MAKPAVSSCGRVLWCGGSDGRVRGWAAASGELLYLSPVLTESNVPNVVATWPAEVTAGGGGGGGGRGAGGNVDSPLLVSTADVPLALLRFPRVL